MKATGRNHWAIVLAGGEGRRLQALTRDADGVVTPKQYCSFGTGESLLSNAIERAACVVPRDRIVTVVAPEHERWWSRDLREMPRENVVVQPANRGTAAGVLLPLLRVLERDPAAQVLLVPSDHHVADERALWWALRTALDHTEDAPESVILLGITPDSPETEYGWIVPARSQRPLSDVEAFVEKPGRARAFRLLKRGALWNSFLVAARGGALLDVYDAVLPALLSALRRVEPCSELALRDLYGAMETHDFSRELLEGSVGRLRVLRVAECGWTDLGTPDRLAASAHRLPLRQRSHAFVKDGPFDLTRNLAVRALCPAG